MYKNLLSLIDFFTRRVHDAARPIASPDDDSVIANACESKVYNVVSGASLRDKFKIKSQPYSVSDMLAHDPLAAQFAGATKNQTNQTAQTNHRWHAPVSGTVKR